MSEVGFRQTAEDVTLNLIDRVIQRTGDTSVISKVLRVASRMLRKRSSADAMKRYMTEPWMKDLLECQEEIIRCGAIPHYVEGYRNQEISYWVRVAQWIFEDSGIRPVRRCLDIGCGFGTLALFCLRLHNCEVYCVDRSTDFQNEPLMRKHGMHFTVCNIELDPIPWDLKFDLIVFTEVLEHLNFNQLPTLRKIREHLAEGGRLYLSTPDAAQWGKMGRGYLDWRDMPYPQRGLPFIPGHSYHFSKDELFQLVDEAGFKVERFDYAPGFGARHLNVCLGLE